MQHFADDNYDIEKAIARHEGLPYFKRSSDLNSQPFANPVPLADAPGTTPGNKPIDEVLEAAPSAVGHGPDKTSSQGDKPSPHAARAVFEALAGGDEDEAKDEACPPPALLALCFSVIL